MYLRIFLLLLVFVIVVAILFARKARVSVEKGMRDSLWFKAEHFPDESNPAGFIEAIPRLAERHRLLMEKTFGERLGYAKGDFSRLDHIIEHGWEDGKVKNVEALVRSFGAYFGEAVRRLQGGEWDHDPDRGYHLRNVGGKATVYPFEKVRKRFQNGKADSLMTFYMALCRKIAG